jgi:hypothetical protein
MRGFADLWRNFKQTEMPLLGRRYGDSIPNSGGF